MEICKDLKTTVLNVFFKKGKLNPLNHQMMVDFMTDL